MQERHLARDGEALPGGDIRVGDHHIPRLFVEAVKRVDDALAVLQLVRAEIGMLAQPPEQRLVVPDHHYPTHKGDSHTC